MKAKASLFATILLGLTTGPSPGQVAPFATVTTGDIVLDLGSWIGAVWADFNNDGFLDLFVCNGGGTQNGFYRNNGNGTFTKIAEGYPAQDTSDDQIGAAAADYDNDGSLDLVVTSGVGAPQPLPTSLYHNEGNGTFTRVSGSSIATSPGFFGPCTWADFDRDGWVDLFVTDHGSSNNEGGRNRLFHNAGDGTFTRITAGSIVNDVSVGFDCLWADYDNDGFADLLVINASPNASNFLYHNNGNGTFSRAANAVSSDRWSNGAVGAAWGDFDNDGWFDLFVAGYDGSEDRLYKNNRDGTFTAVANTPMAARRFDSATLGGTWGDYDNDGHLDLFVTSSNGGNRLFHNQGDGTFTEIMEGTPVTDDQTSVDCWVADWVDYDNDGALDLFVTRNGEDVSNALYHNTGNANSWLEVSLLGTAGNAAAIGAKLRVSATIGGKAVVQVREINDGGRGMPLTAHFGLGDAAKADRVRIEWPSGSVQEFNDVPVRQLRTYVEPPRLQAAVRQGATVLSLRGARGQYQLQSSSDLVHWSALASLTITNRSGAVEIADPAVASSSQRFYRVANP